ncbi:enoyl-CoA hydratase/isomerase family protein [Desulfatitalea tepidiphila]|uniref:enoyl-CoA hydratase/isomerase family protein n=1 Tax=Desulfatitalea tepidiphila TaxID=1185843 RepID=UPI0006B64C1B|nr:enoyl-CoA hydratase [Desulfatitalea tepidiphila]
MKDKPAQPDDLILTEVNERVATLTLNQPQKLNALSPQMEFQAIEVLKKWSVDPNVGAVVVTGAGRGFCVGGDISKMGKENGDLLAGSTLEQHVDGLRQEQELSWLLYNMPKVTIAAVNGPAMGAGLGICLACDLRICSDKSKFGAAYASVGLGGDFGTSWLLAQYVGGPKAKELFFLSSIIDAAEAHRIGLVNQVVRQEDFQARVTEVAAHIAHGAQTSFRYMKANINLSATADFRTMLDREAETHLRCGMTEDFKEGVQAFLEKRPPKFPGR